MMGQSVKALGEQWASEHQEKWDKLTSEKLGQLEQVFQEHVQWLQNHATMKDLVALKRHFVPKEPATTNEPHSAQNSTTTPEAPETSDNGSEAEKRRHSAIAAEPQRERPSKRRKNSLSSSVADQPKSRLSQLSNPIATSTTQASCRSSTNHEITAKSKFKVPIVLASRSTEMPRLAKVDGASSSDALPKTPGTSWGRASDPPKSLQKGGAFKNPRQSLSRRQPAHAATGNHRKEENARLSSENVLTTQSATRERKSSHGMKLADSSIRKSFIGTKKQPPKEQTQTRQGDERNSLAKNGDYKDNVDVDLLDSDAFPDDMIDANDHFDSAEAIDDDTPILTGPNRDHQHPRRSTGPLLSGMVLGSESDFEEDEVVLVSSSRLSSRSPQSSRQALKVNQEPIETRKPESFLSRLLNLGKTPSAERPSMTSNEKSMLGDKELSSLSTLAAKDMHTTGQAAVGAVMPTAEKTPEILMAPRRSLRKNAGRPSSLEPTSPAAPRKSDMNPQTPDSARFASSETEEDISMVPDWAKGSELARLLERQSNVNPYEIFGRTKPLLVGDIFPKKKKKPAFRN